MVILAVDTSAIFASCAIVKDERLVCEYFINNKLTHSTTLMPMIEHMLKTAQISMADIDLLAVSNGPGSFTGIRIGVATIKGIAAPLNIPCAGVSTLAAMANNTSYFDGIICCVMDARCAQVYNALFSCKNGKIERICEDRAISLVELEYELTALKKQVVLVGDGAELLFNSIKDTKNIVKANEKICFQSAYGVALEAKKLYNIEKTVKATDLAPVYLRMSQAQRQLEEKKERENDSNR